METEAAAVAEFEVKKASFSEAEPSPVEAMEETNGTNGGGHHHEDHDEAVGTNSDEQVPNSNDHAMDVDGDADAEGSQLESEAIEPQLEAEPQPEAQNEPEADEAQPEQPMKAEPESQIEAEDPPPSEPEADPEATPEADVAAEPVQLADDAGQSHEAKPEVEDQPEAPSASADLPEESCKADSDSSEAVTETAKPEPASAFDSLFGDEPKKEAEVKTDAGVEPPTAGDDDADNGEAEPAVEFKSSDEVFDVEDDGKEIPPKPKAVSDADYFANLDREELEWYQEHVQDHDKKIQCTSCFKQVNSEINAHSGVFRHPLLAVVMCKGCSNYYDDGEWAKDDEGFDMFCRWCGQGGDIMLCDKCTHAFCKKCLQRNLGRKFVSEISSSEEWKCLVCDPKQIYELRALYYALYINQKDILEKKLKRQEELAQRKNSTQATPKRAADQEKEEIEPEVPEMAFAADTFLDDNFSEALKTLTEFQTIMDEEQKRWEESGKALNPDIATTITRKLRKFYIATRQSMESLDRALATAYVAKFPEEAKRIHLGKDDEVIDAETEYGSVKKRQPKPKNKPVVKATPKRAAPIKKKPPPKKKVVVVEKKKKPPATPTPKASSKKPVRKPAPKPKKKPAPKPVKKAESASSSKVYVTPSLMGGGGGSGAKKKAAKASTAKGKKRPAPASASRDDSDESDIEILSDSEQSPPPAKKPRPGPKSKTRY